MNGDKIEADVAYTKIYKSAKKSIYVIDNYIGLKTLELLRAARDNTQIIVFSDNVIKCQVLMYKKSYIKMHNYSDLVI